jgi:hypothetical protein
VFGPAISGDGGHRVAKDTVYPSRCK